MRVKAGWWERSTEQRAGRTLLAGRAENARVKSNQKIDSTGQTVPQYKFRRCSKRKPKKKKKPTKTKNGTVINNEPARLRPRGGRPRPASWARTGCSGRAGCR